LVIAIDGHSSSGKSTISKDLASTFGFIHIDTGAMYRAVTFYCLSQNIDTQDPNAVGASLDNINIVFKQIDGRRLTFLNGEQVEKEIRTMHVSSHVSHIASISAVRRFLVDQQRSMKGTCGIIMDGRDIGTVVFPDAHIKFFVSASIESRSARRYDELVTKGITISKEEVIKNLEERDFIDSNREDSPLVQADDAIYFDTTSYDRNGQLAQAIQLISKATRKEADA